MNSYYLVKFIKSKKDSINLVITNLQEKLTNINITEKRIRDELLVKKGDHVLITKLKDLLNNKGNIIMNMVDVVNKMDNLTVLCDKILFDNIIMWTIIVKNLKLIYEL